MSGSGKLVRGDNGSLRLQGVVNFHSVVPLYEEFERLLAPEVNSLDCRGILRCDSSAVSMLLACRRLAQQREIDLRIEGMGEQLLSLAKLYEVEKLLTD